MVKVLSFLIFQVQQLHFIHSTSICSASYDANQARTANTLGIKASLEKQILCPSAIAGADSCMNCPIDKTASRTSPDCPTILNRAIDKSNQFYYSSAIDCDRTSVSLVHSEGKQIPLHVGARVPPNPLLKITAKEGASPGPVSTWECTVAIKTPVTKWYNTHCNSMDLVLVAVTPYEKDHFTVIIYKNEANIIVLLLQKGTTEDNILTTEANESNKAKPWIQREHNLIFVIVCSLLGWLILLLLLIILCTKLKRRRKRKAKQLVTEKKQEDTEIELATTEKSVAKQEEHKESKPETKVQEKTVVSKPRATPTELYPAIRSKMSEGSLKEQSPKTTSELSFFKRNPIIYHSPEIQDSKSLAGGTSGKTQKTYTVTDTDPMCPQNVPHDQRKRTNIRAEVTLTPSSKEN